MEFQPSFPLLVAFSVMLAFASIALLVLSWVSARQKVRVQQRAAQLINTEWSSTGPSLSGFKGLLSGVGERWFETGGARMLDAELPLLLAQAGWRGREGQVFFLGLQIFLPVAATATVAFLGLPWLWPALDRRALFLLFSVFAVAYLAPRQLLRFIATSRRKRIIEEVPVFADLMRIMFDVGLGIDQALVMVANENRQILPELSSELAVVIRQVATGGDRSAALEEMARGLQVPELTEVVALLRQIDRYGGAVQEPLLEFSHLMQDKRRTELQEKVGKLSGKMTVVMVLFLFPALLVVVGGPGFLAIIRALSQQ